jgi:hypothetical protein
MLLTPVVHLDLRISPRIFEKIQNYPNVIHDKKPEKKKKSRDTVPLKVVSNEKGGDGGDKEGGEI